jgi:hypothetical protein
MDSTTEQWTLDCHLLSVQVGMINQITQVIGGKLVLDEVLHAIALQLHDTLQVGGCLIFKALQCQPMAGAWVSLATAQKDSKQLSQERFQKCMRRILPELSLLAGSRQTSNHTWR